MPLHHHGGTPHTKRQQRRKTDADTVVFEESAGFEREIHTEPFNHRRWEQTVQTHVAGNRPALTAGGTLSISEDAAALAEIGADTTVAGGCISATTGLNDEIMPLLQEAKGTLDDDSAQAAGLLGSSSSAQAVGAAGEQAKGDMDAAMAAVQAAVAAVAAAQASAQAFYGAVTEAATRHSS